jgi:Cof subfamily protein (haloacid dehalogenase superfamily)
MTVLPIRLIVADLDGTLLDSAHVVSPMTEQAVRQAIAQGVLFTVATGKTFPSTPAIIHQFDIRIPVICGNGTAIYAPDGTILSENPIPLACAVEAVEMAQENSFVPVVYMDGGLLASVRDANVDELIAHHEPVPEFVPDVVVAMQNGAKPHKLILMHQDPARVEQFQYRLEAAFEGRAQVIRSGLASVVEVLPLGVTKGTALLYLLDYLEISPQETIAFGDNCNDLDMIQRAGIGVAMGHAPVDVREGADYVTGTNDEDGVGHALHRFVLASRAANGRTG